MFVDLKGLGTDHVTWCWGTEEDIRSFLHAMARHIMDITAYRLNRQRG